MKNDARSLWLCLLLLAGISSFSWAKTHVEIAEENSPAVVAVNVLKPDGTTFTGTGFVVTPDGVIATSRHVIENALYLNVTFNTGAVSDQAHPVALAKNVDLALIKIGAKNLPTVTLVNSDYVLPGQEITVIGNPRRLQNTVSSGLISQVRQKSNGIIWHQISAPISPSSSGSPVFDSEGRVISIAFSSYPGEGNQNLNFSVPSNYLIWLLQENNFSPTPDTPAQEMAQATPSLWDRLKAHVAKSWEIFKRLFH